MSFKGGQSIEDKLYAFKYFIAGQGISFVVLKATTSELLGPKRKHLNYLISMTNETNVSIPNLTKCLMQRAKHNEWPVSFKSLITIHHLMSYGNERFIQNLASSTVNNRSFHQLASSFMDRTSTLAYDMSTFLRRYSLYINAKIYTYRSLGLDFCRLISSSEKRSSHQQQQTTLKEMPLEKLIATLPILQEQFDNLIAFDASPSDLNNGIINSAFSSLYKDFVKLYMIYQWAILRLLELYFQCQQLKRVQELYEAYRKFLVRMDKVSDFMRVIDSVGMDKSDLPNLSKTPSLSLTLLERHLKQLSDNPVIRRTSTTQLPINSIVGTTTCCSLLQPLELGSIYHSAIKSSSARARSSLHTSSSHRNNSKSPITQVPSNQQVPRLKSLEAPAKRQKQRFRPTTDWSSGFDGERLKQEEKQDCDSSNAHNSMKEIGGGGGAKQEGQQEALADNNQLVSDMDLLLDSNEATTSVVDQQQEPDLILIDDECSSSRLAAVGGTGNQQQPSGWVQV